METTSNTLAGKQVVVLGGSAGIGLAVAQLAALLHAQVTIVSSNQQRLNQSLASLPQGTKAVAVDLSDEAAIKAFFDSLSTIDHLVYTAGENLQLGPVADMDITAAKQFLNIRYWGAMTAIKYATPKINPSGSIVLTSGVASIRPGKGWSLGTSICSAMEALTKVLALEMAPIRVNIVAPGMVMTQLWDNIPEANRNAMYEEVAKSLPAGYITKPEEIAPSYIHLMTQPYITGQRIIIDGGYALL
ncbi:SDR family oxidoreductase [Filimonas lacunae]|nr:SDR family oxidoreductase [Filimonas lacunae]BAV04736.1 short chain dehydrogenase [Filimonas lacunae]